MIEENGPPDANSKSLETLKIKKRSQSIQRPSQYLTPNHKATPKGSFATPKGQPTPVGSMKSYNMMTPNGKKNFTNDVGLNKYIEETLKNYQLTK
jgi:hypothetical protein